MLYFIGWGAHTVPSTYRFADFRLDCVSYELLRAGRPTKLERKPLQLLILLTSRQGQLVTRAEIAEHLWSSKIYVDTEHGINTAVRKLRLTLRDDPAEPTFIKTVTGIGYRFVASVATEPEPKPDLAPNIAFSGIEDSSHAVSFAPHEPASISLPTSQLQSQSQSPSRRRGILWFIFAAAILLLATLALLRFRHPASAAAITSLAVIPLDNFSADPGQEYLADGMTDELTTMIARNSTLQVTSRTSVMQYKGARRPLSEIAHALGVDGIVEGSIARKGNQIHMTLQLIRADTDSHLWAQSFDRDSADTALAEEAAQEIAKKLRSAKPIVATQRYVNPAAHDAYLRGKYLWFSDKMMDSGPLFQKATEIQPDYAEAWAGVADYYGEAVAGDQLDPRIALPLEEAAAKRALALGSDLAEAHLSMAAADLIARWDWTNADIESQRAMNLDPHNSEIYYFRACVMSAMNRKAEAIELGRKSVELAPYERPAALSEMLVFDRQYDAALAELRLRLEALPNNAGLLFELSDTWRRKGNSKEAVHAWAKAQLAYGNAPLAALAWKAYQQGGARGFLQWQLHRREADARTSYVSPVELASYHAQLGEKKPTLALLEEGYRQRATDMRWITLDPAYDFLDPDPQYQSILKSIGEPPAK